MAHDVPVALPVERLDASDVSRSAQGWMKDALCVEHVGVEFFTKSCP